MSRFDTIEYAKISVILSFHTLKGTPLCDIQLVIFGYFHRIYK